MRVLALLTLLLASTFVSPQSADSYLKHDWYTIELIVYKQANASAHFNTERVLGHPPREIGADAWVLPLHADQHAVSLDLANDHVDLSNHAEWHYTNSARHDALATENALLNGERYPSDETDARWVSDYQRLHPDWLTPYLDTVVPAVSKFLQDVGFQPASVKLFLRLQNPLPEPIEDVVLIPDLAMDEEVEERDPEEVAQQNRMQLTQEAESLESRRLLERATWHGEGRTLDAVKRRLERSGMIILQHGKWHFNFDQPTKGVRFYQQMGPIDRSGEVEHELKLAIAKRTFYHAHVDIWSKLQDSEKTNAATTILDTKIPGYRTFSANQIVTVGKLSYFDHPYYGVLMVLDRLEVPDDLKLLAQQANN